jgi:DNA-binding transcriptional MocR family regulator
MQATPNAIDALTPDVFRRIEALPVGAGWLPPEWYGEDTILDAVRQAMRIPANRLRGYGHPLGFLRCASIWPPRSVMNCSRSRPTRSC